MSCVALWLLFIVDCFVVHCSFLPFVVCWCLWMIHALILLMFELLTNEWIKTFQIIHVMMNTFNMFVNNSRVDEFDECLNDSRMNELIKTFQTIHDWMNLLKHFKQFTIEWTNQNISNNSHKDEHDENVQTVHERWTCWVFEWFT